MDLGKSFDQTLKRFGISAAWLSRESGVNAQMISRFRNGKEVQTDTLEKLLAVLPFEMQQYFFSLLLGQSPKIEISEVILQMDQEQLSEALLAISESLRRSPYREADQDKEPVAVA